MSNEDRNTAPARPVKVDLDGEQARNAIVAWTSLYFDFDLFLDQGNRSWRLFPSSAPDAWSPPVIDRSGGEARLRVFINDRRGQTAASLEAALDPSGEVVQIVVREATPGALLVEADGRPLLALVDGRADLARLAPTLQGLLAYNVGDLSGLPELPDVRHARIHFSPMLKTLRGLGRLAGLETLAVRDCLGLEEAGDLSGLRRLSSLEVATAGELHDLQVRDLPLLQTLNIQSCESLERLCLSRLEGLARLSIDHCVSLRKIEGLGGPARLKHLRIGWSRHLDGLDLSGLASLQSLELFVCGPVVGESLAGLSNLEQLTLVVQERMKNLDFVSGMKNLRSAYIGMAPALGNLEGLRGAERLEFLIVSECSSLVDIGPLSGLKSLEDLSLTSCRRVQRFSPLLKCLALESLRLDDREKATKILRACAHAREGKRRTLPGRRRKGRGGSGR
jgi:hypothetical protein